MAPFADAYSDQEIAAVSNYIIGHSAESKARSGRPTFMPLAIKLDYWKPANDANLVGSNGNI
jgi:hypothetical protein